MNRRLLTGIKREEEEEADGREETAAALQQRHAAAMFTPRQPLPSAVPPLHAYHVEAVLGQGAFGKVRVSVLCLLLCVTCVAQVWKVRHKETRKQYAMKVLDLP